MPRIAVASGKGGTGKTLVSTSLAWSLARRGQRVRYVDCDVEAPNGHLFLHPEWIEETRAAVGVPELAGRRCSGCGACQEVCAFNAILALESRVMVFAELCHDCGACQLACPEQVLSRVARQIGTVRRGRAGEVVTFDGALDIGEAKSPPLIEAVLRAALPPAGDDAICLIDAPPGTSCSAIAVARAADLVLLVTEPTPFGLHDLELALQMCQALGKPTRVVLNRAGIADGEPTRTLLATSDGATPLVAELPFAIEIAEAYAAGRLVAEALPDVRPLFDRLIDDLLALLPTEARR